MPCRGGVATAPGRLACLGHAGTFLRPATAAPATAARHVGRRGVEVVVIPRHQLGGLAVLAQAVCLAGGSPSLN